MRRPRRKVPVTLGRKVRQQAHSRCGYCLCSEALLGMPIEFEHLIPLATGGRTVERNLWLSCRRCNSFKGVQIQAEDSETLETVNLFNPREQLWNEHFRWSEDGTEVVGFTPIGRATVSALKLNNPVILVTRRLWVSAGWWPPED